MRNYFCNDRIHYSVLLKDESRKTIKLYEHIDGFNRHFSNIIGVIHSWRADIIKKFLDNLIIKYSDGLESKTLWNEERKISTEIAMKLLFSLRICSSMEQRLRIENGLEIIYSMSDEEVSFWVWKVLSLKKKALNGFKAMYL